MADSIAEVQETTTNSLESNQQVVSDQTDTRVDQPEKGEICRSNMNSKLRSNQQEVTDTAQSRQQEVPDPADARAVQATQDESCRTGTGLGSNQQEVHDQADTRLGSDQQEVSVSAGTGIAQAAQDENRKRNTNSKLIHSNQQEVPVEPTADTENKPDTGLTSEVNMEIDTDVRTDQATRQKNWS